jgi:hypothetical protein
MSSMSLADTLRADAVEILDAVTSSPDGLTVRAITDLTGIRQGRAREALAYLLGASSVTCATEQNRGATVVSSGSGPAQVWRVASQGALPPFDHVYAAIEDVQETLAQIWSKAPHVLRHRIERCMVWLERALKRIDGETVD